jgi:hypothetical protein
MTSGASLPSPGMFVVDKWPCLPDVDRSRTLTALTFIQSALVLSGSVSSFWVPFYPQLIFTWRIWPQIWRFVTPFLMTDPKLNFVFDLYFSMQPWIPIVCDFANPSISVHLFKPTGIWLAEIQHTRQLPRLRDIHRFCDHGKSQILFSEIYLPEQSYSSPNHFFYAAAFNASFSFTKPRISARPAIF